ncbi:isopenicillin N synthase family dioxygenase [Maritalea sp.]|uniref:isopenicillin N synthase family dioxygenase n=1 Tax=Maritalea sp. TaxID=2003361 RepID=UPI003EFA4D57
MTTLSRKSGSEAAHLPLISVKGLRNDNQKEFEQTAKAIGEAAQKIGFFRICDHGIDVPLIEATYRVAAQFFALPEAVKRGYYIGDSPNHRGYVPFTEKGDYPDEVNRSYEAFDLGLDLSPDDPDFLAGNRVLGPNVWPELAGFRGVISQYYSQVAALGRLVTTALEMYLDLPTGAMTSHMRKPISQLRLLHYVRQSEGTDRKSVNMGAHTDYECLTLLHTRNKGLQVMAKDDQWIDVPADPRVLIVNIGDMLEAWSNGLLRSTPHRVLNLSPERYSLPYFVAADYNTMIEPFPQLISMDRPAQYDPFMAGAHLERMLVRDFPYLRNAAQFASKQSDNEITKSVENPFEKRMNRSDKETCLN